jgi:pyridoxine 5-phosphate synthase
MTKLSVNVNKLATLRNSRGKNNPDVLQWALDIISFGAEGITVHPRPDGRHIRKEDVFAIAKSIQVEFNIEGYPDADFLSMAKIIKPAQCTLVPDPPHVLTSNAGWKVEENVDLLKQVVKELHDNNIRTSLFIDPASFTQRECEFLKSTRTDRVELYTEAYAESYGTPRSDKCIELYIKTAEKICAEGIELNAGHDLNLDNLQYFIQQIPQIKEVSIGHALICDALKYGMKETVSRYLACLN